MKIFLAGSGMLPWFKDDFLDFNRLESFYHIAKKEIPFISNYNSFLLDSGAFTFMSNAKEKINWDEYIERYAEFINKHDIKHFFELDIDVLVGTNEVERLRAKLERLTDKKSIPVWHKFRGKDYWLKMVKDYDYVAIGGIVTREIKPSEYKYFIWLLNEAKKKNCKVHGLGFTNLKGLNKYPFYSVDSTSWLSGNRFGAVYYFDGKTMQKQNKKEGQRVDTMKTAENNFYEWVKFSKYMEFKNNKK